MVSEHDQETETPPKNSPQKQPSSSSKNSNNKNFDMDSSNPYYIHPSDHPGHLLVPTKLNGTNYPSWSISMIHALTAKNKIGFINGSIKVPSKVDQSAEYALWNRCNNMILSWLTHSVEPDLAKGVIHAKTAHQVWEDFKDQFSQKNAPAVYRIQKSLASLSQGTMTASTYFTKIKGLWDELETYRTLPTCNQMKAHDEQREEDRLMQFLMGLNDTYSTVRTNILMMSPLPNVRQAYSLVIQDETQRHMTSETTENFSIAAAINSHPNSLSKKFMKNKHCEHCNRDGHTIDNCRTLKFHCVLCNKDGHTEDHCKVKNGTYNTGTQTNKHNQSQQRQQGPRSSASRTFSAANTADSSQTALELSAEQLQQLARALNMMSSNNTAGNSNAYANAAGLSLFSNASINFVFTKPWILDSGATDHITSNSTFLFKTKFSSIPSVNLPTGSSAPITSIGDVSFNSNITLKNVLCVPSFRLNLMSVSKLTKSLNCLSLCFLTFVCCRTWLRGRRLARVNNVVVFITCLHYKEYPSLIKFLSPQIYGTCVLDTHLHLVSNYVPLYYLQITWYLLRIIVMFAYG